ncbi:MAG: prepilin peptidase leader peptidase (prepilin peptidase) / N-methyltransferase [Parcubacteria group bacterium]|nr:prepilin peptidase leader peptidase (prepilin peptidase) / N-methyltransferase [Parcubacteria group bacterium]
MIPFFLFVLGVLIGSFLNVLGLRWNSGKGIEGRSFCVVCKKDLPWWELVPVISFVGLGGKCSGCKSKISWQYPLVELWTGLIFLSLYSAFPFVFDLKGGFLYILAAAIFCIYVVLTIYDVRHKILPDELVYAAIILGFASRLIQGGALLDYLVGPILFGFFGLIWLLSRGRAMGFGDAKLALSLGLLLGAPAGFSALVLAFWIGSVITLTIMILGRLRFALFRSGKGLTMKSEIPFAPFLILGAWISLIYHLDLFHVLSFFNA